MKKLTIRQFMAKYGGSLATDGYEQYWAPLFLKQGFVNAEWTSMSHWSYIHKRCSEIIGDDNYIWFGNSFWFTTEEQAVLFKLMS